MPQIPGQKKDGAYWRGQITKALELRRTYERWWDANLKAYAPMPTEEPDGYGTRVNTNRDFTLVERKKADLFYQRPDVTLQPSPMLEGPILGPTGQPLMTQPTQQGQQPTPIPSSQALASHEAITNELLGADGIDATRMVHQTLFDVLALSGVGFTVMGYESATVDVPHPSGQVDPMTGQPVTVPVPIQEDCFWHYLPPKQALIPHAFRSTEWDKAPWLGYTFTLPLTPGNRAKFKLPADFTGSKKSSAEQHFDHGTPNEPSDDVFTGTILWYRSCLYRDDRPHPDHLSKLVLVDGIDEPTIDEDSPDQTIDPKTGGLTPDSLIGFPMHPLNMRTLTDSSFPPADCTMIRPLVNELNRFREQMVEYRDAQTLKWIYNTDTLPKESLLKIVRAPIGGMIGVPGEAFVGEGCIKELPHGSAPRESFQSNDYIDNDIARTTAIDSSGAGVQSTGSQTATETQVIAANANARLDFERGIVLQWYVKGVTKFATLIQRYLPVSRAAQIVGTSRAQTWDVWRKTAPANCIFTALPDSALRTDQAVDRDQSTKLYAQLANDPYIQKGRGLLLERLFRKYHIDPTGIVQAPDPAKPEPPKVSLSFKGEDLIGPQAPIVIEILQQQGVQITAQAITAANTMLAQVQLQAAMAGQQQALLEQQGAAPGDTKHGGMLAPQESLSKHHAEMTGGMQGTGAPAALGMGGGHLQ